MNLHAEHATSMCQPRLTHCSLERNTKGSTSTLITHIFRDSMSVLNGRGSFVSLTSISTYKTSPSLKTSLVSTAQTTAPTPNTQPHHITAPIVNGYTIRLLHSNGAPNTHLLLRTPRRTHRHPHPRLSSFASCEPCFRKGISTINLQLGQKRVDRSLALSPALGRGID